VSGFPVAPVYGPADARDARPGGALGEPGEFPYTRGIHPTMYRGRPWTMRQYAGFSSAAESNRRYRYLLEQGTTGLSVAFDLPTQMGYDSDAPIAAGEVGKVGVPIDTVEDMKALFDGIPLGDVSTSMTINAPASLLLLMYEIAADEQGVAPSAARDDPERRAQGVHRARDLHLPAGAVAPADRRHVRLLRGAAPELQHHLDLRLPHGGGRGDAGPGGGVHARGRDRLRRGGAVARGLDVDTVAPRLSFFFVARTTLLEEVAKFRAARRVWAHLMRDRFGAKDPRSMMLRFHTQTAGVQLTAQQPEVNLVRVAVQALAATLGGTQSLHTNSFDEALALPTEHSARLALRTQQVLAHETDLTATVDPFAGRTRSRR
jgi:methylmalonyl-CoA mutase N-terminal domain/subunit